MNRRAANALRVLAVCYVLNTIASVVAGILRDAALAKLRDPDDAAIDSHALVDRLQSIMRVSWFTHVGFVAASLVGIVVLAISLERGRALANAAIALLLAYLGFSIYAQLEPSVDPGIATKAMWILSGAAFGVAGMLPLVAAARAVPGWKHAGLAVGGGIALMVLPTVLDAFLILADISSAGTQWLYRGTDVVYTGWFVAFGVVLARALQHGAPTAPADTTRAGPGLDGAPLRVIGWAILVRIGVGVLVAIASIVSTIHGSYDSLAAAAIGSTVIGAIMTCVLIGGLSGYVKYPAPHRSDGLYVVIGLLVVGVILDIVVAKSTSSLIGLLTKTQHADSMWSMPSLSDMESMQATVVWGGRVSLAVGVASVLLLLGSLTTTARSVDADDLAGTSSVTMGLVVVAAIGAIVVGAWMPHARRSDEGMLLVAALVVLVVAIVALVNLLRVLFGVASAVEARGGAA